MVPSCCRKQEDGCVTVNIPIKGTEIYNLKDSRGYVSIHNIKLHYYHKFYYKSDFLMWLKTGIIKHNWKKTVYQILTEKENEDVF